MVLITEKMVSILDEKDERYFDALMEGKYRRADYTVKAEKKLVEVNKSIEELNKLMDKSDMTGYYYLEKGPF